MRAKLLSDCGRNDGSHCSTYYTALWGHLMASPHLAIGLGLARASEGKGKYPSVGVDTQGGGAGRERCWRGMWALFP